MSIRDFSEMERVESVRLIAFDQAEVVGGFAGGYFLIVGGQAPCFNMQVDLAPRIYLKCPEYWGIEVVGSLPGGFCLNAMRPFTLVIPLDGIIGSYGIEVIGHDRVQFFELSGGCDADGGASLDATSAKQSIPCPFRDGNSRDWAAWLNKMPGSRCGNLIVTAEVNTQPGYTGRIRFGPMDKRNPPSQHAEVNLVEEAGAPGGWHEIRGEMQTGQDAFHSVIIHCHDEVLTTITEVPTAS